MEIVTSRLSQLKEPRFAMALFLPLVPTAAVAARISARLQKTSQARL